MILIVNPRTAVQFLVEWYNFTHDARWPEGIEYDQKWPGDQKAIMEYLSWGQTERRKEVLLLDPYKYNGVDGRNVRHLYGPNKRSQQNDYDISRVLQDAGFHLQRDSRKKAEPRILENAF